MDVLGCYVKGIKMEVFDYLCSYDKRNTCYIEPDKEDYDYDRLPRESNCACDNCFYGRDKLAMAILKNEEVLLKVVDNLKEVRNSIVIASEYSSEVPTMGTMLLLDESLDKLMDLLTKESN